MPVCDRLIPIADATQMCLPPLSYSDYRGWLRPPCMRSGSALLFGGPVHVCLSPSGVGWTAVVAGACCEWINGLYGMNNRCCL